MRRERDARREQGRVRELVRHEPGDAELQAARLGVAGQLRHEVVVPDADGSERRQPARRPGVRAPLAVQLGEGLQGEGVPLARVDEAEEHEVPVEAGHALRHHRLGAGGRGPAVLHGQRDHVRGHVHQVRQQRPLVLRGDHDAVHRLGEPRVCLAAAAVAAVALGGLRDVVQGERGALGQDVDEQVRGGGRGGAEQRVRDVQVHGGAQRARLLQHGHEAPERRDVLRREQLHLGAHPTEGGGGLPAMAHHAVLRRAHGHVQHTSLRLRVHVHDPLHLRRRSSTRRRAGTDRMPLLRFSDPALTD